MTRLRGRAPRGQRVHASSPYGHWHTTTMISSIRLDGTTASMTLEGATDTEAFRAYVREVLCPTLRPGDLVVMDNLSPHKSDQTIELIAATGAKVLFLPPYSPDLNPIEKMWSKVKALFAQRPSPYPHRPGSRHRLRTGPCVTPNDALGWFTSCGYSFC